MAVSFCRVMSNSANCLILTNIFPPIRGGSAAVYENMARYGDGRVLVLAPYRNYQNGRVSVGWLDYDKSQPFKVYRMELLRPLQENVITRFRSVLLFLLSDIPLRLKILRAVARIIKEEEIKVICIGELDSGSWIGPLGRIFFGCKIVNYIHGEEITTQDAPIAVAGLFLDVAYFDLLYVILALIVTTSAVVSRELSEETNTVVGGSMTPDVATNALSSRD